MNQFFQVIMSDDSNPDRFLIFFMTLAGCSLVSIPITWFVSDSKKEELTNTLNKSCDEASGAAQGSRGQKDLELRSMGL